MFNCRNSPYDFTTIIFTIFCYYFVCCHIIKIAQAYRGFIFQENVLYINKKKNLIDNKIIDWTKLFNNQ